MKKIIHLSDGYWYYWDEIWALKGPYNTKAECQEALYLMKENRMNDNNDIIKEGMECILEGLKRKFGLDISGQHFIDTPGRVSRAYDEIFSGLQDTEKQIKDILSTAFKSDMDQMIVIKDIHVFSMCPHHFLPVEMYVDVAYIPNGYVLGLSKIPRLVEVLAKRPVIQEQVTEEITKYLMSIKALGAAVRIKGQHFCMRMRGVKKSESIAVTTSVVGAFRDDISTRQEFLNHIQNSKNF